MGQLLPLGGQLQDYFLIGMKTDDRLFERTDMFLWYGIRGQAEKTVHESEHAAGAWGIPLQKRDTAALLYCVNLLYEGDYSSRSRSAPRKTTASVPGPA